MHVKSKMSRKFCSRNRNWLMWMMIISAWEAGCIEKNQQSPSLSIDVNMPADAITRIITDSGAINKWWPGNNENEQLYRFKNAGYHIGETTIEGINGTIFTEEDSVKFYLHVLPTPANRSILEISGDPVMPAATFAGKLAESGKKDLLINLEELMDALKTYFDNQQNIYGFTVTEQKVTDASLISQSKTFRKYPATQDIYEMIASVNQYIREKGGEISNYPMLNVRQDDSVTYHVMVAIPTKRDLPSSKDFQLKKMVLGNILMAEVRGGIHAIREGEEQLNYYVLDHKKVAPAIPFQSLVTNRMAEPDTNKWVTKLYYPVFN